jgi:large subunit ribosomal protein L6e
MARKSKNTELAPGINRLSRSAAFRQRGAFKIKNLKKAAPKAEKPTTVVKQVGGKDNGKQRTVAVERISRFYPTEDIPKPLANRKKARPTKLRSSITPGTVLILLAGRFRGKRVVFLKQLPSGLLLVTGPFKINGVPLRRVNQAYVIATSTKVTLPAIDAKFDDAYFKPRAVDKKTKGQEEFLQGASQKAVTDPSRLADQKVVDKVVLEAIKKQPLLKQYLGAHFTLTGGQFPHELKF